MSRCTLQGLQTWTTLRKLAHLRRRVYPINVRADLDDLGGFEEIEDGVGIQWWGAQVLNVDAALFHDVADEFAHEADLVGGEVSSIEEAREFCANCFGVKSHQAADDCPTLLLGPGSQPAGRGSQAPPRRRGGCGR